NTANFQLYKKTLTSTATITPTITLPSATNQFANLIFVGGNINATPVQTATSSQVTCATALDNCAAITPGAVSASHILVVAAGFRYLTPQDLRSAGITAGVLAFAHTTLNSNVTVTGSATNVLTVTLQTPVQGCPCRADIRYSGWANFAAVTNEPDFDFWVNDG